MKADPAGLVLAGFDGHSADEPGPTRLLELGLSGFIVFGRNVRDPAQVHRLLGDLAARCSGPPLLAVDQEGGRVARLRAPLTVWPPFAAVGSADDAGLAERVGEAIARELAAVGFNLDFAPCLDVNSNPDNPVIGDRALSDRSEPVERLGPAFLRGLERGGTAAVIKHFPGHGDVDVDSHEELPLCPLPRAELESVHLRPFAAAIRAGARAVMTAHVLYPAIDPDRPATLSPLWIDGVLRKDLGFSGVVLTDDMEMGAIVRHIGVGPAAVEAVRAGVDGVLVCRRLDRVEEAVEALRAEAAKDAGFAARCARSLERLRALASAFPPAPAPAADLERHLGVHEALADELTARARSSRALAADPTRDGVIEPDRGDA